MSLSRVQYAVQPYFAKSFTECFLTEEVYNTVMKITYITTTCCLAVHGGRRPATSVKPEDILSGMKALRLVVPTTSILRCLRITLTDNHAVCMHVFDARSLNCDSALALCCGFCTLSGLPDEALSRTA